MNCIMCDESTTASRYALVVEVVNSESKKKAERYGRRVGVHLRCARDPAVPSLPDDFADVVEVRWNPPKKLGLARLLALGVPESTIEQSGNPGLVKLTLKKSELDEKLLQFRDEFMEVV